MPLFSAVCCVLVHFCAVIQCRVLYAVDNIMAFAWEPVGHKFSFIHGEMPRISVSFYSIIKGGNIELASKSHFVLSLVGHQLSFRVC